jgi:hypothetical protein
MHLLRAILGVTTFRYAECEGFNDAVQGRSVLPHVSRCGTRYLHDSMFRDRDMVQSTGNLKVRQRGLGMENCN